MCDITKSMVSNKTRVDIANCIREQRATTKAKATLKQRDADLKKRKDEAEV